MESTILPWVTFLPLIGIVIILLMDREHEEAVKIIALATAILTFVLSCVLYVRFDPTTVDPQFVIKRAWIPRYGIDFYMGLDGISLFLVLLTTFIMPIVLLASWRDIKTRVKEYNISMLLLATSMVGTFLSLNLFLFYIFWELMVVPMYLIIGIWGGPRRVYAAIKFFLYTLFGSLLMLVAILALYVLTGSQSFDLFDMMQVPLPRTAQLWMFLAFALAFAIKVPMFPFHTWLPDAHVEAPTAGSVILAGVLLKMGTYGFIRFGMPLFPAATSYFAPMMCIVAVIGIIYGALVAMVQPDVKKLVAYSSVSHLGFVMLGLFALNIQSVEGGILQMINHGLSTGALFLVVGMIYERRHTRLISDFGGLSKQMPIYSAFFMIITLSSIGLPGLNGFVGEFLVLVGSFRYNTVLTIFAASGVILAACYMLWMFKRMMFGELDKEENKRLADLSLREIVVLVPVVVVIVWIGVYPSSFLRKMDASVNHYIARIQAVDRTKGLAAERPDTAELIKLAEEPADTDTNVRTGR